MYDLTMWLLCFLLGMAFAGSFLGRKYMGYADILLHKLFRKKVGLVKYLYWRYFCDIPERHLPRPELMRFDPKSELRKGLSRLLEGARKG